MTTDEDLEAKKQGSDWSREGFYLASTRKKMKGIGAHLNVKQQKQAPLMILALIREILFRLFTSQQEPDRALPRSSGIN